jgi:hypothetical protein
MPCRILRIFWKEKFGTVSLLGNSVVFHANVHCKVRTRQTGDIFLDHAATQCKEGSSKYERESQGEFATTSRIDLFCYQIRANKSPL